jgi:hypothetical protein
MIFPYCSTYGPPPVSNIGKQDDAGQETDNNLTKLSDQQKHKHVVANN